MCIAIFHSVGMRGLDTEATSNVKTVQFTSFRGVSHSFRVAFD